MNPQSYEVLEYHSLRELLAGRAQTPPGRSRALQLLPSTEWGEVVESLRRTHEAEGFLRQGAGFALGGLPDPGGILELLKIQGASLEARQILDLLRWMEAGQSLRQQFAGVESEYPHLMKLIGRLPDLRRLVAGLRGKLLPDGRLNENANPELRRLRHRLQRLRARLQRHLHLFLRRTPDAYIQEEIVTIRNERFVIPIRVEHKGHITGVIHAASSSGATVFIEPLETIELNNELVELGDQEQVEVARILLELSDALRAELDAIEQLIEVVSEIDLIAAMARLAIDFQCCEPQLSEGRQLILEKARHILLENGLRSEGRSAVPISLDLDPAHSALIISGPNAGGKTVALKTIGLCALMAQSGMLVPAETATLPLFRQVLADIGDQQSILANLSTFTAHIQNVRRMAEVLVPPALVLLDEVGTGTDPEEGAALAVAIVDDFKRRGAMVIATTHYQALKMYARLAPDVITASVAFDEETLQPTYRLIQGLAGASSGLHIARRLGLSSRVVEQAHRQLKSQSREAERYLAQLKREWERQQTIRVELEEARAAVARELVGLEQEFAKREEERSKTFEARLTEVVNQFSQQAMELLGQVRDRKAQIRLQRTIDRRVARLKSQVRGYVKKETRSSLSTSPGRAGGDVALRVGMDVRVRDLNQSGTIAFIGRDEVLVDIGPLRFRTTEENLEPVTGAPSPSPERPNLGSIKVELKPRPEIRPELILLGCTVEEALDRTDKFLDEATLASLGTVRIIHGSGTGALRRAIRNMLASHPHVASFRPGPIATAEAGSVTIVELQQRADNST